MRGVPGACCTFRVWYGLQLDVWYVCGRVQIENVKTSYHVYLCIYREYDWMIIFSFYICDSVIRSRGFNLIFIET